MILIITIVIILINEFILEIQSSTALEQCILNIHQNSYEEDTIIINGGPISYKNSTTLIFNTNSTIDGPRNKMKLKFYIITINNSNELKKIYDYILTTALLNRKGKFLISCNGGDLDKIFKISWEYYITKIVVIQNEEIFTYFPLEKCFEIIPEKIGSCKNLSGKF